MSEIDSDKYSSNAPDSSLSLPGIIIFLSCLLILYGIADYALCNLLILPGFLELEQKEAISDSNRCRETITRELHHLSLLCGDWSSWDDMYSFAQTGNVQFIQSNFQWPSLHNSQIEFIAIFNTQKSLVWSGLNRIKRYPYETVMSKSQDDKNLCNILCTSPEKKYFSSKASLLSGLMSTGFGPLMIASRPILTSKETGPPKGFIVVGRFLDNSTVEKLSNQIHIHFRLLNQNTNTLTPIEKALFKEQPDEITLTKSHDESKIISYSLLGDMNNEQSIMLKVVLPRKIADIGIQTAQFTSFVLLILLTIAICSTIAFFIWFRDKQLKQQLQIETLVKERTRTLIQKEDELEQKKRMEAIGLMAGGVAHDLNNILSGIVDHPAIIVSDLPEGSKLIEPLSSIRKSGEKAMGIVKDLLTIARGYTTEKTPHSINELASQYLKSPEHIYLKKSLEDVSFKALFSKDIHMVKCSPANMHQCIMNLVRNGAEAIDTTGTVKLRTYTQFIPETDEYNRKGNYTVLEVSDTGHGISKEDVDRIFDPFYSRKILGRKGTGLGLAVVWNIIQDHNGTVIVSSSPQGTVFTIHLPAADSEKAPDSCRKLRALTASGVRRVQTNTALKLTEDHISADQQQVVSPDNAGTNQPTEQDRSKKPFDAPCRESSTPGTIIVVDDEQLQRDIATSMLNRLGFNVICFSTGEEAIAHVKKEGPPTLLLIDLHLTPGLNGTDTFGEIRKMYPCQKALLASGLSDHESLSAIISMGGSLFMQKPYSLKVLKDALNQIERIPLHHNTSSPEEES